MAEVRTLGKEVDDILAAIDEVLADMDSMGDKACQ